MSGFSYKAPRFISSVHNPAYFPSNTTLSIQSDVKYLRRSGGSLSSPFLVPLVSVYGSSVNSITLSNSSTSGSQNFKFVGDAKSWSLGTRNTLASAPAGVFYIYDNTSAAYRLVLNASGYIGIGTTTPTAPLDIGSTASFQDVGGNQPFGFVASTNSGSTINPSASITATSIRCDGSITITAGGYYTTSDRRIKKNIEDLKRLIRSFRMSSQCYTTTEPKKWNA